MENAADALKMAAAVLIFIIAIASSFSLFGTAKQTADSIVGIRDKQAYLESADLAGVLYSTAGSYVSGSFTTDGDRIVNIDDVISTIYRYNKEKYGVTIIEKNSGNVIARFDSNTENIMRQWYSVSLQNRKDYVDGTTNIKGLKDNIATKYVPKDKININLESIYKITVIGNNQIECGAPWYGNDTEIQKRINADIEGKDYTYNSQTYEGKNLLNKLQGKKIIEVTNEIDQSNYLADDGQKTDLLQQYELPTVEIVYIID